jgi:hypothetical protein
VAAIRTVSTMSKTEGISQSSFLQPGEQVAAAVVVQPAGSLKRQAGGALGTLLAGRNPSRPDGAVDGIADALAPAQGLLAVTNQRVVIFKTGAFGHKPKSVVAELPAPEVQRIVHERKLGAHSVQIWCTDGSGVIFDALGGKDAEAVATAFSGAH